MKEYNPAEVMEMVNTNPAKAAVMLAEMVQLRDEIIRRYTDELWEAIEFLNCKVEDAIPTPESLLLKDRCIDLIKKAKVLVAVKLYRESTGASLRDAADYIRALKEEVLDGKYGEHSNLLRR